MLTWRSADGTLSTPMSRRLVQSTSSRVICAFFFFLYVWCQWCHSSSSSIVQLRWYTWPERQLANVFHCLVSFLAPTLNCNRHGTFFYNRQLFLNLSYPFLSFLASPFQFLFSIYPFFSDPNGCVTRPLHLPYTRFMHRIGKLHGDRSRRPGCTYIASLQANHLILISRLQQQA